MGSSSSKPARKLVKEATKSSTPLKFANGSGGTSSSSRPVQSTKQTFVEERQHDTRQQQQRGQIEASETKTRAVMEDAQDPQLLANLQKLGQVTIPKGKVHYQTQNPMLSILSARERDTTMESEAATSNTMIKNRLPISTIVAMLDARKECTSQAELEQIAKSFDVDLNVLQNLAVFINSPSVDPGSTNIVDDHQTRQNNQSIKVEDGDDALQLIEAVWTEPAIEDQKRISA